MKSPDIKEAFGKYTFKGLRPGFVNESAFNTGIQTGIIQQFELGLIQELNRLYTFQEKYNTHNESMVNSRLERAFPESEKEIRSTMISMMMNMNDLQSFEKNLIEQYKEILLKL